MPRQVPLTVLLFISFCLEVSGDDLRPGDTELLAAVSAHGIVSDARGGMYFAGQGKTVYKFLPDRTYRQFAKVDEKNPNTHIWSLKRGPDGNLYCAAKDCVLRLTPQGRLTAVVRNDNARDVGFGDLAFDPAGRLCVTDADNNRVIRCAPDFTTSAVIIEGKDERLSFLVGIAFPPGGESLYLASCRKSLIVKYPYADGRVGEPEYIRTPGPCQYFAVAGRGALYVSLVQSKSIFKITDGDNCVIRLRPASDGANLDFDYFNAIAVGENGYSEEFLYFTSPQGVYRTYIGDRK